MKGKGRPGVILTLAVVIIVAVALLLLASPKPAESLFLFLTAPLSNAWSFGNWLERASLLLLTGLGVSLAFRAGAFNLGGEGQTSGGAFAALLFALAFPGLSGLLGVPGAILVGGIAGLLLAGFSAFLKRWLDTNVMLSTFLLSGIVTAVIDQLHSDRSLPFNDPESYRLATLPVTAQYRLPDLLPPSHLNPGLFIALVSAVAVFFLLFRTARGYEWRMSGLSTSFAEYGGIRTNRYLSIALLSSGFFHGIAGSLVVLGHHGMSVQGFTAGLGWSGIAVALIARSHPLLLIPSALVFAWVESGTSAALLHASLPFELSLAVQAIVFLLITVRFRVFRSKEKAVKESAP